MKSIIKYFFLITYFLLRSYSQNCKDYDGMLFIDCDRCEHILSGSLNSVSIPDNETLCVFGNVSVNNIYFGINSTLVVCGVLSVDNINITNNKYVYISPSGVLKSNTIYVSSNSHFYNRGIVESENIYINTEGYYYNLGVSAVTYARSSFHSNGYVYNYYGCLGSRDIHLYMNNTMCVGYNSILYSTNSFTYNSTNGVFNHNMTNAYFIFSGNVNLNRLFTDQRNIYVCLRQGTTVNNPTNWGNVNFITNCTYNCPVLSYMIHKSYSEEETKNQYRLITVNNMYIINKSDFSYTLMVFDVSLRNIYKKDNIKDKEFYLDLLTTNQFIILHFIFEDGYVETVKYFGLR